MGTLTDQSEIIDAEFTVIDEPSGDAPLSAPRDWGRDIFVAAGLIGLVVLERLYLHPYFVAAQHSLSAWVHGH